MERWLAVVPIWGSVVVIFACVLIGFIFGKNWGVRQGRRRMAGELPLQLRAQVLLNAQCPICDGSVDDAIVCDGELMMTSSFNAPKV